VISMKNNRTPGQSTVTSHFVWGYDEITWLYVQDESYRKEWLKYAWHWVREHDQKRVFADAGQSRCQFGAGKTLQVSRQHEIGNHAGRSESRRNNQRDLSSPGKPLPITVFIVWK